jgi:hypothetical protein
MSEKVYCRDCKHIKYLNYINSGSCYSGKFCALSEKHEDDDWHTVVMYQYCKTLNENNDCEQYEEVGGKSGC